MGGIKLHHESARNSVVAVECFRTYQGPYDCPLCGIVHHHKTVHLHLDNEGDVIVSRGVWDDLKDVPLLPFSYGADVKKPPAVILSMNGPAPDGEREIIHHAFEGRR